MSTKIYSGYRAVEGTDPIDLCEAIREALLPVRERLILQMLATDATRLIDQADLAGEERPARPLGKAARDFEKEQRSLDKNDFNHNPFRFEASLGRDKKTGRLHIITYVEREELRAAFEAIPAVEEYSYWNNADPPEGISEKEWSERGKAWNRMLPGAGAPAETMSLTFILSPDTTMAITMMQWVDKVPIAERVLPFVPDIEKRAKVAAHIIGYAELGKSPAPEEDHPHGVTKIMKVVRAANAVPNDDVREAIAKTMHSLTADELSGDDAGKPVGAKARATINSKLKVWVAAVCKHMEKEPD